MDRKTPELDHAPKYVNSPQSAYYDKKALLYGSEVPAAPGQERDPVIVTEGYTDAVLAREATGQRAVALGTSGVSEAQAAQLARMSGAGTSGAHAGERKVTLMLDGDEAGQGGTDLSRGKLIAAGLDPQVARLPEGEDPASFVQARGNEAFARWTQENARPWAEDVARAGEPYAEHRARRAEEIASGVPERRAGRLPTWQETEQAKEAIQLAAAAPTATLAEERFAQAFEHGSGGVPGSESASSRYYRWRAWESEYGEALQRSGLERVPESERMRVERPEAPGPTPGEQVASRRSADRDVTADQAVTVNRAVTADQAVTDQAVTPEGAAGERLALAQAELRQVERQFEAHLREHYADGERALEALGGIERAAFRRNYDEAMSQAAKSREAFEAKLGAVHARPEQAYDKFHAMADRDGFKAAVKALHERPEAFGTLKGTKVLGWENSARRAARSEAQALYLYGANEIAHAAAQERLDRALYYSSLKNQLSMAFDEDNGKRIEALRNVFEDPKSALIAFDRMAGYGTAGYGTAGYGTAGYGTAGYG